LAEGHHDLPNEYGVLIKERQRSFCYSASTLQALETALSGERLSTYMAAAGFDRRRALQLYLWNARLSAAFFLPLQCTEVTLRNSVHRALTELYGKEWPTHQELVSCLGTSNSTIEKVRCRIKEDKYEVTISRIVAGLPFDFWAALFNNKFDRLWRARLHATFPNLPRTVTRKAFSALVRKIITFRNRIAHHESIIKSDVSLLHTDMLCLIRYSCAQTAEWAQHHSCVPLVFREKP
jgi:hypothetical protein